MKHFHLTEIHTLLVGYLGKELKGLKGVRGVKANSQKLSTHNSALKKPY